MSRLTELEIKKMKDKESKKESFSKGRGTLVFRKVSKTITGYYRYWKGNQSKYIKLGDYKATAKTAGLTLAQLREKALELAAIRQKIFPLDLKDYLEQQRLAAERAIREQKKAEEARACRGTFKDLLTAYTSNLHKRKASSATDITTSLNTNVIEAFPHLAATKAAEITSDDIVLILRKLLERGNTSNYNRVRSYLMAAFNQGIKADYDPRAQLNHGKRFNIQYNPVISIPRHADLETVRERQLSNQEINILWANIESFHSNWNRLYALLVKFMFACFGNRPKQLSRCLWSDIDFNKQLLTFTDMKGKNATPKKRVIPLTTRAINLLQEISKISACNPGPFYIGQRVPIAERNLSRFIFKYNDWLVQKTEAENSPVLERFTAKDIRRTATRLLTDCRIAREQRYLLQSRSDNSIESKHYDHDDRLPEKRDAAKIYDQHLGKIIQGKVID